MTFSLTRGLLPRIVCFAAILTAVASCIKDDGENCATTHMLHVKAYASVGGADVSTEVNDVILYVFDKDRLFVERIDTRIGQNVRVNVPKDRTATIVAWGNLLQGSQTAPAFAVGEPMSAGMVELIEATRAGIRVKTPDDLFYGTLTLSQSDLSGEKEIPMYRKTGRMNITLRGLKEYFGFADDDYSVRVNAPCRAISIDGTYLSGGVVYSPTGDFDGSGVYKVPTFNLLPGEEITVDIFHGGDLLVTINTSDGTSAIGVAEGLTTNLLVNYLGQLSVAVEITGWDAETVWKNF